jgi:dipeptide/tripeptide permease
MNSEPIGIWKFFKKIKKGLTKAKPFDIIKTDQKKRRKKMILIIALIFLAAMFFIIKNDIHVIAKEDAENSYNLTIALLGDEDEDDKF